MNVDRLRLLVCVGPGGVGKTSVSAALAIAAARRGRRVLVLTIDPARRLADALGIALDDREHRVALPDGASGTLDAAMLETQASWDAFVRRVADDPERVLANRVYRAFSRTLARSHAYVAWERLHHALASGRWDLIVLDTPPTRSALDVLDAPAGLARFADERIVGAFAGAARPGVATLQRALGMLLGAELAGELASFVALFAPMRAGFAARAAEVRRALSAADTGFVLVAAPGGPQIEDASFMARDLARRGVRLDAVIFNRAFHADPDDPSAPIASHGAWDDDAARALLARAPGGSAEEAARAVRAARASRDRARSDDGRASAAIDGFLAAHPVRPALVLPLLPREPCTPAELLALIDAARPRP